MALSKDLISQFVKITNDDKKTKGETFVYGTIVEYNGDKYVQLDGSELLTPISTTTDTKAGERVTVMIKNHSATVTGNVSSPSARSGDLEATNVDVHNLEATYGDFSSLTTNRLNAIDLVMDCLPGGKGIAFGKTAELEDVAEFEFSAKFNSPVYGKALGMDRLPAIPSGSDLNNYVDPGCYAIQSNSIAATCSNIPINIAGRLEVWSATGEGIRSEQWSYLRQRYIPYNSPNAVWERDISRNSDNVLTFYNWWRTSLTPTASDFVYHEPTVLWGEDMASGLYMTAGDTANLKEAVSAQRHGIVLTFCAYNGTDDTNHSWQSFYVPKQLVAFSTSGHTFTLSRGKFAYTGTKYLYINDTSITGHDDNNLTGTSNGITYANNKFVLRYVFGV